MCRVCPSETALTCRSCKEGYFLKTFAGGNRNYQACWSTLKLMFGLIGSIISSLLLCLSCKLCFDYGRTEPTKKKVKRKKKTPKYASPTKRQPKPVVQEKMFDSSQMQD
jgi:hypothetical protein